MFFFFFFFFFSSRRRHTRCSRDWSSDVCSSDLNVRPLLVQLVRTPEDKRDRTLIDTSHANVVNALGILEGTLAKHKYVAGNEFTFGDIPLAAAAQRWFNLPVKRPAFAAVESWYGRVKERPGFKKWIDLPLV